MASESIRTDDGVYNLIIHLTDHRSDGWLRALLLESTHWSNEPEVLGPSAGINQGHPKHAVKSWLKPPQYEPGF